ncbi:MAG: Gfo/Idh/MocA family oxidoreductase [Flavobacteriales bacterium]
MKPLKLGLIGVGHLGKIHLKCLLLIPERFEIVGFFDLDPKKSSETSINTGIKSYNSIEELISDSDVIDIVTPTLAHFDCAVLALNAGKHVFIEKPISHTVAEAEELANLVTSSGLKLQVGHVERFNPAYTSASSHLSKPVFIEAHRLAEFNPRGTDVPVVLDLMIHDLDIILHTVDSEIKEIRASGVAVVSETPDICNARIEFENGCVANLTASRISLKNMRKTRFFQKDAYITVDFFKKQTEILKMKDIQGEPDPFSVVMNLGEGKTNKEISFEKPTTPAESNPIRDELFSFSESIINNTEPQVTINDGLKALKVAYMILDKISS